MLYNNENKWSAAMHNHVDTFYKHDGDQIRHSKRSTHCMTVYIKFRNMQTQLWD